jgi:hypothetical protein
MSIAEAHAKLTAPGARFEMETLDIRGVPTRTWKNGPKTLQEVFALGRSFGEREFLIYEGDRATYEGWARATLTLARPTVKPAWVQATASGWSCAICRSGPSPSSPRRCAGRSSCR